MQISAYTYNADTYCPPCILVATGMDHPSVTSAEIGLDILAKRKGINRFDEYTFDSGDFPKVVFSIQIETSEQCGRCGKELD